jgi:hypothetical protein
MSASCKPLAIVENELEAYFALDDGETAPFARYLSTPSPFAAFIEQELGEHLTDDIRAMLDSVWRYPVTIVPSANQTGKTYIAARLAVAFYKLWSDAQVWTTAAPPLDNLKNLLWGQIGDVIAKHPAMFAGDEVTSLRVARSPSSYIVGTTIPQSGTPDQRTSRFSGKHPPHGLYLIDEANAVPPEVFSALEGCMSGGFTRMVLFFNPHYQSGPVYQMECEGHGNVVRISALDHPNVVEGRDVIPGAVDRETTVRRINEWTRPLAPGEPEQPDDFEVPAFLVGAVAHSKANVPYPPLPAGKRRIENAAFPTKVLGLYPAEGERQGISNAWIAAAVSRWHSYVATYGEQPPATVAPVMGLDVADEGKDLSVAVFRYGGWVRRVTDMRAGVDADAVGTWAAELYRARGCQAAMVDGTGVGAGVAPKMTRAGCAKAHKVMVGSSPTVKTEMGEFALLRDQLLFAVREWLRTDAGAMLPPDEMLRRELVAWHYDTDKPDGKIRCTSTKKLKADLGRSPDRLMALAMTFYEAPAGAQFGWD